MSSMCTRAYWLIGNPIARATSSGTSSGPQPAPTYRTCGPQTAHSATRMACRHGVHREVIAEISVGGVGGQRMQSQEASACERTGAS